MNLFRGKATQKTVAPRLDCMGAPSQDLANLAAQLLDELGTEFPLKTPVKLVWRNYRVAAGKAYLDLGVIGLSKSLIVDEERLRSTLLHEYAHLLAYHRSPRFGRTHGPYWQQAMADLGEEAVVRHTYAVQRNESRQKVIYKCVQCGARIDRKRKLPKNKRYVHASCGGPLKFEGYLDPISLQ